MSCPLLEYRTAGNDREFEVARAYCTAVDEFVQPMRADICNDRYDLDHATDCEIFLEHRDDRGEGREGVSDEGSEEGNGTVGT